MSVQMRHRQTFAVKEIEKRSYIQLPDFLETELGLDIHRPETTVKETIQTNREIEGEDGFPNEEYIYGTDDEDEADDNEFFPDDDEDDLDENKAFDDYDYYYVDSADKDTERDPSNRYKRSANQQWKNADIGEKATEAPPATPAGPEVWETITDEELRAGQNYGLKKTVEYIGITLLSVVGFIFIGICFIRDPVACIFAFGTGCPCCIIFCPCIRAFTDKYLDSKKLIRESMNKYMPGVIVKEDGSMEFYEPTPEEIEILHEIIEEITS